MTNQEFGLLLCHLPDVSLVLMLLRRYLSPSQPVHISEGRRETDKKTHASVASIALKDFLKPVPCLLLLHHFLNDSL